MEAIYSFRGSALLVATTVVAAVLLGVLFFSSLASAQVGTEAAPGTTIKVTTKEDELNTDGDCSLREAIEAANPPNAAVDKCAAGSSTERDAILFAVGKQATITLDSQLLISDVAGLTINGQKKKITVSGGEDQDPSHVRVFAVGPDAKLNLNHLTVADGTTTFGGGGLATTERSEVKVRNSTFSGNSAQTGGGIANSGTLEVINSTFSGNSSKVGGGIFNAGTLEVTNSTFSGNSANSGGGIRNEPAATLEVTNSTFSGNSAGVFGGGIFTFGNVEVTNSTFSGNSADVRGGGISTIFGTVTLKNTIVANSTSGGNCHNDGGTLTDGGYNLEDGTSCGFDPNGTSLSSTDPQLASSLANNGGPTKTIALLKASPALDAIPEGTNGCGTEITTDQRGVSRPQGEGCDIGAFEKKLRRR